MSDTTVTMRHIAHICARLARIGEKAYEAAPDGHHAVRTGTPANDKDANDKGAACLRDVYRRYAGRDGGTISADTANRLAHAGFTSFSYLASGSGARVFTARHANGHDYALRIGTTQEFRRRVMAPLVVQPFESWRDDNLKAHIDVLPLVQILSLSESDRPATQAIHALNEAEEYVLDTAMRQFVQAAACTADRPCKDIGILPDGTPVQPDPGQIRYADFSAHGNPAAMHGALARFHAITVNQPLPGQLKWFTPEGRWKQDHFFRTPFRTRAYHQGFLLSQG